jgi:methyl-accepting chemotaxis protein
VEGLCVPVGAVERRPRKSCRYLNGKGHSRLGRGVAFAASMQARSSLLTSMESLKKLVDQNEKVTKSAGPRADAAARKAKIMLAGALFAAILLSIGCGVFVARMISGPAGALVESAAKIAEGDLNVVIDYESADEIGQLAGSLRIMTSKYLDILIRITNSLQKVLDTLQSTVTKLPAASEQVSPGSGDKPRQPLRLVANIRRETEPATGSDGWTRESALLAKQLAGHAEELLHLVGSFKLSE